jgi:hypothetical protein
MRFMTFAAAGLISVACAAAQGSTMNGEVGPVGSDPALVVGSGWNSFSWDGTGVDPDPVFNLEGAFTFTVPASSTYDLLVTDAYLDGDQFTVYNFGSPLFTTSTPLNDGQNTSSFDAAYASSAWSHGSELLGPGNYSITLQTISYADDAPSGAAGIQLESVPEPSAFCLLALGAGLVLTARRFVVPSRRKVDRCC